MKFLLSLVLASGFLATATAGGIDSAIDPEEQGVLSSKAFLDAHPDLKYRTEGWYAYQDGRHEEALGHFRRAASYADKLSQAMLAEMLWNGYGQPADRALAYAWSDIAAERGYARFVILRERFWRQLTLPERQRAITEGQGLLEEYGDEAAVPRMAAQLRRARHNMISKRPRRDVVIIVPGEHGEPREIRGHEFYAAKFWEPKRYRAWVDELWTPLPRGRVNVGRLQVVEDGTGQQPDQEDRNEPRSEPPG